MFDTGAMAERVTLAEITGMRRSMTVGLPPGQVGRLLDTVEALLRERAALTAALEELGPEWADVRARLNQVHRILDGA
jgi:hypothetical protein